MRLQFQELSQHLTQHLRSLYWVSGDEPWQQGEACDAIRAVARKQGYERQVFDVEAGFDWQSLLQEAASLSLFSSEKLLDVRLPSGKPGKEGAQVIKQFLQNPPPGVVMLVASGKLERAAKNSAWYKLVDQQGVCMEVWPMKPPQMRQWLRQRTAAQGLKLEEEALTLLLTRVEGNVLAAAQEADKLRFYAADDGRVTQATVLEAVGDNSRFSIFDLADAAGQGKFARAAHILQVLQQENIKAPLVLWALSDRVRVLLQLSEARSQRRSPPKALAARLGRQLNNLQAAANAQSMSVWQQALQHCAELDRGIKSGQDKAVWDGLLRLCAQMAGKSLGFSPLL